MTDAKRAANYRFAEKVMRIEVKPHIEEGNRIKNAAAAAGQSLQGYILQACRERMERDGSAQTPSADQTENN